MSLSTLMLLAVALGTDAFSLCVGIGMAGVNRRQILLISFTVLFFHIFMPLTGWIVGEFAGSLIGRTAAIIGSVLLIYLGVRMVWGTLQSGGQLDPIVLKVSAWGLILLGASVSMDALSVGFTLGTREVNMWLAAGLIGLVAGAMTSGGLVFGRFLGRWVGEKAQLIGGFVLVGIGVRLFF